MDIKSYECKNILIGHFDNVMAIIYICINRTMAFGSVDSTIKIWDLSIFECLYTLEGHIKSVTSLVLLSNGLLSSKSYDKTIMCWNLNSYVWLIL